MVWAVEVLAVFVVDPLLAVAAVALHLVVDVDVVVAMLVVVVAAVVVQVDEQQKPDPAVDDDFFQVVHWQLPLQPPYAPLRQFA